MLIISACFRTRGDRRPTTTGGDIGMACVKIGKKTVFEVILFRNAVTNVKTFYLFQVSSLKIPEVALFG